MYICIYLVFICEVNFRSNESYLLIIVEITIQIVYAHIKAEYIRIQTREPKVTLYLNLYMHPDSIQYIVHAYLHTVSLMHVKSIHVYRWNKN